MGQQLPRYSFLRCFVFEVQEKETYCITLKEENKIVSHESNRFAPPPPPTLNKKQSSKIVKRQGQLKFTI